MENQYCFEYHEANKATQVDLQVGHVFELQLCKMLKIVIGTYFMSFNFHYDTVGVDTIPTSILQMGN